MKKIELNKPYRNVIPIACLGSRPHYGGKRLFYLCRCGVCGIEFETSSNRIGKQPDCGCGRNAPRIPIPIGSKYNRLTVEGVGKYVKGKGYWYWCRCICDNLVEVRGDALRNGEIASCGCLKSESFQKTLAIAHDLCREKYWVEGTNIPKISNTLKRQRNNTSGITGVGWHKGIQKWQVRITFKGRTYHLGYYENIEAALDVRKIAEERIFEEFLKSLSK